MTVNGDDNLIAGNIKSGVDIFGVLGSFEGEGGGSCQVAHGSVSVSKTTTAQEVANISGLSFQPTFVLFFKSGSQQATTTSNWYITGGFRNGENTTGFFYIRKASSTSTSSNASFGNSYLTITMTSDGFTVSTGSAITSSVFLVSGTYYYYAVG